MDSPTMAVIGHEAIAQRFTHACVRKKLPHAWMFYGMQGIGKASLAMRLAQTALCEQADERQGACGTCSSCRLFLAESHPDFLYIARLWDDKKKSWARDVSVHQVRSVLDFLALTGMRSQRRVVVIDDANRMNQAAANALLKGLEEPGTDVLLLMVCHDLSALPETIRSRCMLEYCAPLSDEQVSRVLKHLELSDAAMSLAASLAQGCPGTVAALQDDALMQACVQWKDLLSPLVQVDVGALDAWLQAHVKQVPYHLLIEVLMQEIQPYLLCNHESYEQYEALHQAVLALLAWSHDMRAHSLRPAPSLLNHILQVRKLLQCLPSATV